MPTKTSTVQTDNHIFSLKKQVTKKATPPYALEIFYEICMICIMNDQLPHLSQST